MKQEKPDYELAEVVRRFGKKLINKHNLSPQQIKTLYHIAQCRTASMGGHQEACPCCGTIRYSYNSCGNRHCPKCQSNRQVLWIDELLQKTLPVKHFHIIFTLPHCLNQICLWNDKAYYKILFASVWEILRSFGYTHYGCETGAIAVLHTWGQNLSLHPHLHCIVPAAGYSIQGKWKHIGNQGRYLYSVYQLSRAFRARFLDKLKRFLRKEKHENAFKEDIEKAYKTNWVVYSEQALAKAENVVKYLGQYTHRVAISNHRILNITNTHVQFIAKDYRDNGKKKITTLKGEEFLRRFCQHILPNRFVRIRYYGIYHHRTKQSLELKFNQETHNLTNKPDRIESRAERLVRITGFDPSICPECKQAKMIVIKKLPRIRSPTNHLPSLLYNLCR